jgi:capsular polysaccharide biosynthesis protein
MMIIPPIGISTSIEKVSSPGELLRARELASFVSGTLKGVRWEQDQKEFPATFLSVSNAVVVVDDRHILYLTGDYKYLPMAYPKTWPYAKYLIPKSDKILLDVDSFPRYRLTGSTVMPFAVAGNWFHMLLDNYARLHFLPQIPEVDAATVALPFWADPQMTVVPNDRSIIHSVFLQGRSVKRLARGIHEVDRLIVPPLGNIDDYIFSEPARFVSNRLTSALIRGKARHPLRLFVSRADVSVRNLVNEAELAGELRRFGFTILCPGDYSFLAQLELFASAEIIAGVHGQGLVPVIVAQNCRAVLEFEAAGWAFTAYRSFAALLGIPYYKLPCDLITYRDPARFDWLARADTAACVTLIERVLEEIGR